jgi:hypothetical protein
MAKRVRGIGDLCLETWNKVGWVWHVARMEELAEEYEVG